MPPLVHVTLVAGTFLSSPYNYIVDPGVREIMGINLKDAVVIFDEVSTHICLIVRRRSPRSSPVETIQKTHTVALSACGMISRA